MKMKVLLCVLVVLAATPAPAQRSAGKKGPDLYFWIWWPNLSGRWQELIDFAAEQKMDGVVIWGLKGWKGDGKQCRNELFQNQSPRMNIFLCGYTHIRTKKFRIGYIFLVQIIFFKKKVPR